MSSYSTYDHRTASMALKTLQPATLRFLSEWIAANIVKGCDGKNTDARILDAMHKLLEETPVVTLKLQTRDTRREPARCWICLAPIDECHCTANDTH